MLLDCPGETCVDDELCVLLDCPGETCVDDELCVCCWTVQVRRVLMTSCVCVAGLSR